MVRNHIAEEYFVSKLILSVSNSHERLGEAMDRFDAKCQIWRHTSSTCFKAVAYRCIAQAIFYRTQIDVLWLNFACAEAQGLG